MSKSALVYCEKSIQNKEDHAFIFSSEN